MKRTDLEALGLEKEVMDKIMQLHGADIEAKKQEIANLKANNDEQAKKITELGENLKNSEGDAQKIADLQKQIDDFAKAEAERKQKEELANADRQKTNNIMDVIGDKKFVNEFTKNAVISQIKTEMDKAENAGKGIKDIFDSITKDSTDIFVNPQQAKITIPPAGSNDGTEVKEFTKFF
jgi:hypothetical protein